MASPAEEVAGLDEVLTRLALTDDQKLEKVDDYKTLCCADNSTTTGKPCFK